MAFLATYVQIENGVAWYKYNSSDIPANKYYSDGSEGWDAWVSDDGILYVRKFQDVPADKQAPGEGEIELWLNGATSYIELEIQSEYTNVAPGDSLVWNVTWYLRKLPARVSTDVGSTSLVSYVENLVKGHTTGISDPKEPGTPEFTLSPNPCINSLTVNATLIKEQTVQLSLYNLQGIVVAERVINSGENYIKTGSLPAGVYLYRIAGWHQIYKTGRIVINRP